MAHYLVTGGCGFIGSHLVDALLIQGHRVRVMDDLSSGDRAQLAAGAELVVGDVRDAALTHELVQGVDGCFHLAAVSSVVRCNDAWRDSHTVNLSATVGLFEAASGGRRHAGRRFPVVYASSSAVYGDQPAAALPLTEDVQVRPCSPYGADKLACELHAQAGAITRGLAAVGLRFFNVYGPRQRPGSPYSGVISTFADRVGRGQTLTVHGDGQQTRDFVHVGDAVAVLLAAMRRLTAPSGGERPVVLNTCTGRSTSILELARRLMALAGREVPVHHGPAREGDVRRSVGSPEALARVLGVRPATSLDEGLGLLLAANLDGGDRAARLGRGRSPESRTGGTV